MPLTSDDDLRSVLALKRIAVIGCSSTPGKAAHEIPAYLQRHGYDIVPVNPFKDEILGVEAVDSLDDIERAIDLVNVFRPSDEIPAIVDDVLARREMRGDVQALWLQLGITHDDAVARAESGGLRVVQDKCIKVEHGRVRD